MKIHIIGAGNVGKALGERWRFGGHEVAYCVRDPADTKYDAMRAQGATLLPLAQAGAAEVVVLATPWVATHDALLAAGDLSGRILIDATNPLSNDLSGLVLSGNDSGGEQVQRWAQGARVVKAFNTVGWNIMVNPALEGRAAVLYLAGDDATARDVVKHLAKELGFEPVDAGGLRMARLLEPFALLWITSAFKMGLGREFAFSLIRR